MEPVVNEGSVGAILGCDLDNLRGAKILGQGSPRCRQDDHSRQQRRNQTKSHRQASLCDPAAKLLTGK
ncbi:hypothetical protein HRbin36_01449 [bacterium HR36]|nr:hypothetical protein HRbin36_01449 [bacterium HR36]